MAYDKEMMMTASSAEEHVEFTIGHPDFKEDATPWWKQKNLRKLYLMMPLLFLGSTTLGYDGSLLNGLQTMPTWQECESGINESVKFQS
jgi:hypothetical protein